jgi:transposase
VHEELKRRGVTLMLLWEEHRAEHIDGHGYSRFCALYGEWRKRLAPTMRQTHVAGDKLFVDWAGDTVPIIDAMTGEVHAAHLFVAVLGASSYTYAEACWSETLPEWIGAHVNAFDFLGGVPKATVPDNLKAGITKPSRYEPGVNRTYQDLADHYGFVVLPARIRRPRDKAKVEAGRRHRLALRARQAAQQALLLLGRVARAHRMIDTGHVRGKLLLKVAELST